jgi:hypothetical protein
VGTAIGAVVGGVVTGLAVSTGADALVLKLEEHLNRDELKAAIIAAIEARRAELHAALDGDAPAQRVADPEPPAASAGP